MVWDNNSSQTFDKLNNIQDKQVGLYEIRALVGEDGTDS
jgi:hypothetical protein